MKIFPLKLLSTQDKAKNFIKILSGDFNPEKLGHDVQKKTLFVDKNADGDKFIPQNDKKISTNKNLINRFCDIFKNDK